MTDLTPKAERTRQAILTTALSLFATKGYEATTMRDIAAEAAVSLGLAYRYFDSKEALILALYQQMAEDTDEAVQRQDAGTVADRFSAIMTERLQQAAPYRDAFAALFGAILTPRSGAELFGSGANAVRERAENAFIALVRSASDAPAAPHVENVGRLLYSAHFAVILFWIRDSSGGQRSTQALLGFIHDMIPWLLRGLILPPIGRELARFIRIIDGVLGV
ncbi:MAG: TetR/AcrR family transcriptional regulator [Anaerolineae bacterium]|nr:TetR/AcrR family transcriptional regulator [Anaerolineae bacterium]NUQ05000.1 TetR/AcrR family transcriptional regulator [Anaerolineae bacterium]